MKPRRIWRVDSFVATFGGRRRQTFASQEKAVSQAQDAARRIGLEVWVRNTETGRCLIVAPNGTVKGGRSSLTRSCT